MKVWYTMKLEHSKVPGQPKRREERMPGSEEDNGEVKRCRKTRREDGKGLPPWEKPRMGDEGTLESRSQGRKG